jgi:hypothetical protein
VSAQISIFDESRWVRSAPATCSGLNSHSEPHIAKKTQPTIGLLPQCRCEDWMLE